MARRFFCLLSAVLVCTSPVFAWSAESFVDDGAPYELVPVSSPSVFRASSRAAASSADSSDDGYIHFLEYGVEPNSSLISASISAFQARRPYTSTISLPNGFEQTTDLFEAFHNDGSALTPWSPPRIQFRLPSAGILPAIPVDSSYTTNVSPGTYYLTECYTDLTLLLDGSSTSFELFYNFSTFISAYTSPSTLYTGRSYFSSCDILVNGSNYDHLSGPSISNHYIINSSTPITSVVFRLYFPQTPIDSTALVRDSEYSVNVYIQFIDSSFIYGQYLTGNSALDANNDQAQDAINEHESVESQWTGSMTENFNKLDISNFTFPSGLVSGFALITGIFQDIWNAMGEYKIVYVFPLTLGIVLLLIGRISRFAGRSSSRKSYGGDGG